MEGLNENQLKAVLHKDGPCCVIAGAGSGKTRVLTHRIAKLIESGIPAENILAVTFTKKAAEEMRSRLFALVGDDADEVNMGTFHSICYRIIREHYRDKGRAIPDIAQEWWQKKVVKEIMSPRSQKFPKGIDLGWQPRQALTFISYQKNHLIGPKDELIINPDTPEFIKWKLVELYQQYEDRKKFENKIDFDDMLVLAHDILSNDLETRATYRNAFQYILVDEYQDTNLAQEKILQILAEEHRNIYVVGDARQSIYAFRAARVELILKFQEQWPDATIITLDTNYRSTHNIVEWANRLIRHSNEIEYSDVKASRGEGSDPEILRHFDEDDEASYIANEIEAMLAGGMEPRDFAVLYRTNAQSRAVEEAMIRKRIPYVVLGSLGFYARKEIKDMLAYMRLALDPHDDESLERVINRPNRYLGKAFINALNEHANSRGLSLFDSLRTVREASQWRYKGAHTLAEIIEKLNAINDRPPVEVLYHIRKLTDYDNWLIEDDAGESEENERIENLDSLAQATSKFNTIKDFLEYAEMMDRPIDESNMNKVTLMSIHRSKGLEYPAVFLIGMNDAILPHARAQTDADIEEERRLCYVAMTRAKDNLYLSYTDFYQGKEATPSPFLSEITGIDFTLQKRVS